MSKIIIATDSFKGSLSSMEVAQAASRSIADRFPETEVVCIELADGGEGTSKILTAAYKGTEITVTVSDPLGRKVVVTYGISSDGKTAILEMSQASGLTLLESAERNPLLTSTHGTGEMIIDALEKGCRNIIIGLGGSATNDGGTGMLEALGFRFIDKEGRTIQGCRGDKLAMIADIDTSHAHPAISETTFTAACDVTNIFHGSNGATMVFGKQKGADKAALESLEKGMQSFCRIVKDTSGTDLMEVAGSGAAGGVAGALKAFLKAEIRSGIEIVLEATGFHKEIKNASLIITGEGKIDAQTAHGKVVSGVTQAARKEGIPVIAIAGIVDMTQEEAQKNGLMTAYQIGPSPQNESDLKNAMLPEVASKRISETIVKALEELSPSLSLWNPLSAL